MRMKHTDWWGTSLKPPCLHGNWGFSSTLLQSDIQCPHFTPISSQYTHVWVQVQRPDWWNFCASQSAFTTALFWGKIWWGLHAKEGYYRTGKQGKLTLRGCVSFNLVKRWCLAWFKWKVSCTKYVPFPLQGNVCWWITLTGTLSRQTWNNEVPGRIADKLDRFSRATWRTPTETNLWKVEEM